MMAGKKRRTDAGPEEKKEEDTDFSNPSQRCRVMGQQMSVQQMGQQQQHEVEEQWRSICEAWRSKMCRTAASRLNDRTHRAAKALRAHTLRLTTTSEMGKDSAHLLSAGLNKILHDYTASLRVIENEYILEPGFVAATGNGEQGELGLFEEEDMERATRGHSAVYKPHPIASLNDKGVIKIRSSGQFSVALTASGLVYAWGCNDEGQLGVLDTTENGGIAKVSDVFVPRRVKGFLPTSTFNGIDYFDQPEELIVDVALGECHAIYLSTTGKVFFAGAFRIKSQGKKFRPVPHPQDLRTMTYEPHLRSSEDIEMNKPPEQAPIGIQWFPTEVCLPQRATKIWSTATGCFALLEDGTLWSWGFSQYGELGRKAEIVPGTSGDGTQWLETSDAFRNAATPRMVELSCGANVEGAEVENVGCGMYHAVLILREFSGQHPGGQVVAYTMGKNGYGELGQGTTSPYDNPAPRRIVGLDGCDIAHAAGGLDFTALSDVNGTRLMVCGSGKDFQLGTTDAIGGNYQELAPVPCLLEGVSNSKPPVKSFDCGETHTIVICENGDAYSWGLGENGALGHGRSNLSAQNPGGDITVLGFDVPRPKKIATKNKVRFLMAACGTQHSLILFTNDEYDTDPGAKNQVIRYADWAVLTTLDNLISATAPGHGGRPINMDYLRAATTAGSVSAASAVPGTTIGNNGQDQHIPTALLGSPNGEDPQAVAAAAAPSRSPVRTPNGLASPNNLNNGLVAGLHSGGGNGGNGGNGGSSLYTAQLVQSNWAVEVEQREASHQNLQRTVATMFSTGADALLQANHQNLQVGSQRARENEQHVVNVMTNTRGGGYPYSSSAAGAAFATENSAAQGPAPAGATTAQALATSRAPAPHTGAFAFHGTSTTDAANSTSGTTPTPAARPAFIFGAATLPPAPTAGGGGGGGATGSSAATVPAPVPGITIAPPRFEYNTPATFAPASAQASGGLVGAPAPAPSVPGFSFGSPGSDKWRCDKCFIMNELSDNGCIACGGKRA